MNGLILGRFSRGRKWKSRFRVNSAIAQGIESARLASMTEQPELPPDPLIGQKIGPYEVLSLLAVGKRGRVYRVRHQVMGRECVLKTIRPDVANQETMVERFRREIRIGSALQHPNIVDVHDAGVDGDRIYLVMEYFPGRTLEDLYAGAPASCETVVQIGLQVLSALMEAHESGVVHREIEPSNILLDETGTAKILDFGIAKAYQESMPKALTDPVELLGNPSFMAPEQVWGADTITERADIYGLGAVLYFCLTGQPPYDGIEPMEVVQKIGGPFPAIGTFRSDVPEALEQVVLRATETDLEKRYPHAELMQKALEQVAGKAPATTPAPVPQPDATDEVVQESAPADGTAPHPAAPGRPVPYLRIFGPMEGCWECPLGVKRMVIGRSDDADIDLENSTVSRYHATIYCNEHGEHVIEDNHSRAGVLLNGKKVTKARLNHEDTIQITYYVFQYRVDDKSVRADGSHFPLNFLPSSMGARFRVVHHPPEKVFAAGDTLPVGQGGIFLPIRQAPPKGVCVEVELSWPGGKKKAFLSEVLGTLPKKNMLLLCLKLHNIDKELYRRIVSKSQREEWISVPRV